MVNSLYPRTLTEALEMRRDNPGAQLITGGSDIMVTKKFADTMIYLNGIDEMKEVAVRDGSLLIGGAAVYSDLLQNDLIPELLKRAMRHIASPAIRNVGTIAGNICNASPAGDTLPVLYCMDALVIASSIDQEGQVTERRVPIKDFIKGVRKIDLADTEIVTAIEIPDIDRVNGYDIYYEKVGGRQSEAISKLSFAGMACKDGDKLSDIRFAFGSVGITVLRVRKEEEKVLSGVGIDDVVGDFRELLRPIDDQRSTSEYRRTVCLNLLGDFLAGVR